MKPKYEAVARIAFSRETANPLGFKDLEGMPQDDEYSVSLDTQVQILQSDTLAAQVIREVRLDESGVFGGKTALPQLPPASVPSEVKTRKSEASRRSEPGTNCSAGGPDRQRGQLPPYLGRECRTNFQSRTKRADRKLNAQEAGLKNQYAQPTVQLGPSNPKVQELSNQLKETQSQINAELHKMSNRCGPSISRLWHGTS